MASTGEEAGDLRARARDWARAARGHPFLAVVGVVALLAGIYYGLLAAPVYVSTAAFAIRGNETVSADPLLATLVGQPTTSIGESVAVIDYVRSHEILSELDSRHDLRELYSAWRFDFLNRLPANASDEEFLKFYRARIKTVLDREANIVTLEVHSFTPENAQAMATSILGLAEEFINNLSQRIRDETLAAARSEVDAAQELVREIRLSMARFRNESGELDPVNRGIAAVEATMALQAEVTKLRAELASLLTFAQESSPRVQQLRAQIAALETQVANQQQSLASSSENETLAGTLIEYEGLLVSREYAEGRLVAAMAALDSARLRAEQREKFVARIVNPNMPDEATRPRRLFGFALTVLFAVVGYGIVSFAIAGIRDHEGTV